MGDLDQRYVHIHSERNLAQTLQLKQAERMVKRSRVEMVARKVEKWVTTSLCPFRLSIGEEETQGIFSGLCWTGMKMTCTPSA